MPGLYRDGDYDLAGFAVGAVERGNLLPRGVAVGDAVLGLASSGLHSNAFSLVRRVVEVSGLPWSAPAPFDPEVSLGQALLTPTRIYVPALLALHRAGLLKAAAHITGGGVPGNLPRVLPEGMVAVLEPYWSVPPVFGWLAGPAGCGRGDAAGVQLRDRHGGRGDRCGCRDGVAAGPGGERGQDRAYRGGQRGGGGADRSAAGSAEPPPPAPSRKGRGRALCDAWNSDQWSRVQHGGVDRSGCGRPDIRRRSRWWCQTGRTRRGWRWRRTRA